ncbi:MAG: OmpA family protein [Deltaproteobacteria bacterium]|nr:MAG: OmpA family protein [Deltaproteobacteria bacterium]
MVRPIVGKRALYLCPGILLLLGVQGCLATRGWVTEQMAPLEGRVSNVETRLGQTEAKADQALDRLDHLRLERRFVLNLKEGANFPFNSDALTPETRSQIDGFLSDLKETDDAIFLVAGHTDNLGSEAYNYELGQKRAASVARYLIAHKRLDPLRVTAVSYGKSAPIADNATREGRRKNRRIEILVYKEAITASSGGTAPRAEIGQPERSETTRASMR